MKTGQLFSIFDGGKTKYELFKVREERQQDAMVWQLG